MSTTQTSVQNSTGTAKAVKPTKRDLYQETTNKIIALLENGVLPWRRTWSQYGLAKNYVSGKAYKGINMILMNNTAYNIPYFLSFKQAKELGGTIKKGAKAEQVLYFKLTFKDENGKVLSQETATQYKKAGRVVKVLRFLRYFSVFNIADIEGIEYDIPEVELKDNEQIEKCDQLVLDMPNPPKFETTNTDKAFYAPLLDLINMPSIKQFENSAEYYSTLFHEMIHSTGHETRLNRTGISELDKKAKNEYSKEELIAEMGAAFLCATTGIDYDAVTENSAAYINGWLKVLKADKRFIFQSAAAAQKAANYILGE